MLNDTTRQYEQLSEQYAKTQAGGILKPKVKRSLANKHYNQAVEQMAAANVLSTKAKRSIHNQGYNAVMKDVYDADAFRTKIKRLRNTQNKNAFENFASTLKEHRDWKIFKSLPKRVDVEAQGFDVNRRNDMLTKSLESDVNMNKLLQKSNQTAAAATLQSAVRRKTDMMKKRQLVGEEQLKQMEETQRQIQAAKADKAKKEDIAAKQLQAISKRIKAQSDVSKIKQAKDKIGAAAKRLLTERVDPHFINEIKKTVIMNKNTAGQRLVVNKKLKLVSKKRHDAGVFGYETRQDYLDLAQQYKPIMTKGQKK
jgi:hypothetical protein